MRLLAPLSCIFQRAIFIRLAPIERWGMRSSQHHCLRPFAERMTTLSPFAPRTCAGGSDVPQLHCSDSHAPLRPQSNNGAFIRLIRVIRGHHGRPLTRMSKICWIAKIDPVSTGRGNHSTLLTPSACHRVRRARILLRCVCLCLPQRSRCSPPIARMASSAARWDLGL